MRIDGRDEHGEFRRCKYNCGKICRPIGSTGNLPSKRYRLLYEHHMICKLNVMSQQLLKNIFTKCLKTMTELKNVEFCFILFDLLCNSDEETFYSINLHHFKKTCFFGSFLSKNSEFTKYFQDLLHDKTTWV